MMPGLGVTGGLWAGAGAAFGTVVCAAIVWLIDDERKQEKFKMARAFEFGLPFGLLVAHCCFTGCAVWNAVPELATGFKATKGMATLIQSAPLLLGVILIPVFGIAVDYCGRRTMLSKFTL